MTSLLLGGIQHPHYGITHHPKNWFKCHSIVHYKRSGDPSASASIGPQLPSLGRQDWKQATVQTDSYLSNPLVAMGNEVALSSNFPNATFSNFYPFSDLSGHNHPQVDVTDRQGWSWERPQHRLVPCQPGKIRFLIKCPGSISEPPIQILILRNAKHSTGDWSGSTWWETRPAKPCCSSSTTSPSSSSSSSHLVRITVGSLCCPILS